MRVDPRTVPVFIVCRDRLQSLAMMVKWLLAAGQENLVLLDNDSAYPPLLEYLRTLEADPRCRVVRLGANHGQNALWDLNLLDRLDVRGPYVLSDPDIVPLKDCPADAVGRFLDLLDRYPDMAKAGFGLRLDDLPERYALKRRVITWESQFWRDEIAPGVFLAPIDTTFAAYRPGAARDGAALRTGAPYLARHMPWYADSDRPGEEEAFYRSRAQAGVTNWNAERLSPALETKIKVLSGRFQRPPFGPATRLHLGCGRTILPGWVNVDRAALPGVDLVADLDDCRTTPLPFGPDSVAEFRLDHVLEHIRDSLALFEEMHRVAEPGARAVVRVPHGSSDDASEDPTHVRRLFPGSFLYFAQPAYSRADYGYRGDWQARAVVLAVPRVPHQDMAREEILERVNALRNTVLEMTVVLEAVKPPREPRFELLARPPVFIELR